MNKDGGFFFYEVQYINNFNSWKRSKHNCHYYKTS